MLSVMITANEALLHFNLGSASGVGSSGNKDEDSETEEDSEDTCNSAPDKEAADEFSMQYYEEDLHHLFGEIFKVGTFFPKLMRISQNSRKKLKTQGKNSTSGRTCPLPPSQVVLKKACIKGFFQNL